MTLFEIRETKRSGLIACGDNLFVSTRRGDRGARNRHARARHDAAVFRRFRDDAAGQHNRDDDAVQQARPTLAHALPWPLAPSP